MEDEYERQKIFILVKIKLIWLISKKTLKAILRLLSCKKQIGRVRIIEFFFKSKDE